VTYRKLSKKGSFVTTNPPHQPGKPKQLRVEIPANLNATYANAAIINQSNSEIIMSFVQVMPNDPRARIQSRVVMTPVNAKLFLNALKTQIERYEEKHGELELPEQPSSLADTLFGTIMGGKEGDDESNA